MKTIWSAVLGFVLTGAVTPAFAQVATGAANVAASRYFQITVNLKFAEAPDQEPATETISTEVAVRDGKPGSCKARMLSQVPVKTGSATKYIELGTKLDCNDVHLEGDGLALQFTLETSGFLGMAKTKGKDGVVFDEPMLAQRSIQLSVKLPLDHPKVVFDSEAHATKPLAPVAPSANGSVVVSEAPVSSRLGAPMLVEMTASELN